MDELERPGSVTVVVVLTYIAAVVDLVGGVVMLVQADDLDVVAAMGGDPGVVQTTGWVLVFLGLAAAAVGAMLSVGSRGARVLVIVFMIARLLAGVFVLFTTDGPVVSEAIVSIVLSAVVLLLLGSSRAHRWFAAG